jgi:hypothetical protein
MLLVQPCDIVVRTTGSRSNEPETFTLAKLTSKVQEGQARVSIGPFSVDDDADSKIDLRYRIEVNPLLLDACVFSPEGRCVLGEAPVGDDRRTVGWQTKALKMQKVSTRAINAANKSIESFDSQLGPDFDPAVAASTRTALAEHSIDQLLGSGRFQVVFSDQKIFIGIRRIGRLLPPVAGAVWTALLQHQGRPDQPGPLVRQGSGVPSAETTPATPPPASNEDGPAAPALPNER